jgi:hypothetical protein
MKGGLASSTSTTSGCAPASDAARASASVVKIFIPCIGISLP